MAHNINIISDTSTKQLAKESVIEIPSDSDSEKNVKIPTSRDRSFVQRLFKCDRRRFKKYVQSTTVHGVVHIFVGKSKIRRFLWMLIVLGAGMGCVYNICNRIAKLAEGATTTTTSILEPESVNFPAVTLCNLNFIKKSFLDDVNVPPNVVELIQNVLYGSEAAVNKECNKHQNQTESINTTYNKSYPDLLWYGRHTAEKMILHCWFIDQTCNASDFIPTFTPGGDVCYTFNDGKHTPILQTNGTGTRFALTVDVYVMQHEYSVSHNSDAGIKIAVHPQSDPPRPDKLGIAVPPGKNAFISVRQTNIENKSSRRKCKDIRDTTPFNFLQGEFPYSVSACQINCMRTNIAQNCKCLGAGMTKTVSAASKLHNLDNCTCTAKDICCQATEVAKSSVVCDCGKACRNTFYETVTSYSAFPANYAENELAKSVKKHFNISTNMSFLRDNFIRVNIYFETLNVEEEITDDAYGVVALLSDIGGQLALFLGASVVSVFEFVMWLFDEIKDRCFGIRERKLKSKVKAYVSKRKRRRSKRDKAPGLGDIELDRINTYTNFESL